MMLIRTDWSIKMKKNSSHLLLTLSGLSILLLVVIGINWSTSHHQAAKPTVTTTQSQATKVKHPRKKAPSKKTIDWHAPSEEKPYPDVKQFAHFWIDVSLKKHRVYLMDDEKRLYTMRASTGTSDSPTPKGTFHIQAEHGESFFNGNSGEGAKYWRSFLDHGVYLFHSVPTDQAGNFLPDEAQKLGETSNSHGCIRLSVADAKWFYQAVPVNTKVVIH